MLKVLEELNKRLKLFNVDDSEYKILIGDPALVDNITGLPSAGTTLYVAGDFSGLDDSIAGTGFLPMQTRDKKAQYNVGDYKWNVTDLPDTGTTLTGQSVGTAGGSIILKPLDSDPWVLFAEEVNDGNQNITFPVANTKVMRYVKAAFQYAFYNTTSTMILVTDGSIYKDQVDEDHLVINGSGDIGLAGGLNLVVKVNDINVGAISNPLEYTKRLYLYLVDQFNIKLASGDWLTWIGQDIYGVTRVAGESDFAYSARVVDTVLQNKMSPLSIRDALLPYAEDVVIDDDISSGAFADVTFTDFYRELDTPEIVRAAYASATGGGLIFFFTVILTNPDPDAGFIITNIVDTFKVAGVNYEILVITT